MTIRFQAMLVPLALALLLLLPACGSRQVGDNAATVVNMGAANAVGPTDVTAIPEDSDSLATPEATGRMPATDAWVGRWTGPEGLFLDIAPAKDGAAGHYTLIVKDTLDTEGKYAGTAKGDGITFTRNGKVLTIRPGTGADTGFKYLADKKECLIVQAGKEGYCR